MSLTFEQIEGVPQAITSGSTRQRALRAYGISSSEYHRILRLAADGLSEEVAFVRSLEQAEAAAETNLVGTISQSRDWRAAAFLLERRFPEQWAQKIQVEVEQKLNEVWSVAERVLPEEQFIKLLEAITEKGSAQINGALGVEESSSEAPQVH